MANKPLEYKGHPLQRAGNIVYYGSMSDKYVIMLQIMDTKKVKDLDVATKVSVQLQLTDDVTQSGCSQIFNGCHRMLDAIGVLLCIRDLEKDNGVDLHGNVILGDYRLGLEIYNLFLDGHDPCHLIQEGH